MAATLVGEAAIRIVPTIRGFKYEADRRLREVKLEPVKVKVHADTREATAQMDEWRAKQDLKPVVVPVKANSKQFERDIRQIEHRVRDSPLHQLTTFNIKILGLDALPALAYAAASAAAGLDALGESALALPGLLGGVGSSVGALALGLSGMKQAFSAFEQEQKTTAQAAHQLADDNRTLQRSYRDYRDAVRDTTREIQDLNAENRRSSLNIADAQLSVQEAADRLRQGNFGTVTELRRAQLSYAESIDHLNEVQTKANRTAEDANRVNAEGLMGSDRVQSALDSINKSIEKLDNDKVGNFGRALAKLSPNASAAMQAITNLKGTYESFQHQVADNLLAGMDKDIANLATRLLPTLSVGLSRVATGLNADFHGVFQSLGSDRNKGFLSQIFANDTVMLENLSKALDPALTGILRLTNVSADFLPRLGNAADKVFTKFDNWTQKIDQDGSLKRWIDQGLHAMDDLGHIGLGIIGVIHKIGQAFDDVSGHQGGFLKTFADELQKIDRELSSPEGMAKLEGYLRGAKGIWDSIRGSWDEMKPAIKEIVGYAREFSEQTLSAVGGVLHLVSAVDRVTHVLGPLIQYILLLRTVKMGVGLGRDLLDIANAPVRGVQNAVAWWDKLGTTQAETAATAKAAAAAQTAAAEETAVAITKADEKAIIAAEHQRLFGTAVQNSTLSAKEAREEALRYGSAVDKAGYQYNAFGEVVGRVTPVVGAGGSKIAEFGKEAEEAGELAGGAGAGSMKSKIGALAGALGSGLAGLGLQVAIIAAITALDNLGAAHKRAGQMADEQRQSLKELASAMDSVTGAAGKAAQDQAISQGRDFTFGDTKRNIFDDSNKSGLGSGQAVFNAILPQNQAARDDYLRKADQMNEQKIGQSEEWKRNAHLWQDHGVDLHTLALAAGGDQSALQKVTAAYNQMDSHLPFQLAVLPATQRQAEARREGLLPQDLGGLTKGLGVESFASAAGVRTLSGSMVQGGAAAQSANQLKNGKAQLKPGAAGYWGFYGGLNDGKHVFVDDSGQAHIVTDRDPHVSSDVGSTVKNSSGQFDTTLTTDATRAYVDVVPGFATGGLVGGVGGPTDDANLAKLSRGEHITRAAAVNYYGPELFDKLNSMSLPRFAPGMSAGHGFVPLDKPTPPPPPPPPKPQMPFVPGLTDIPHPEGPVAPPPAPEVPGEPPALPPLPKPPGVGTGPGPGLTNPGLTDKGQNGLDTSGLPGYHQPWEMPGASIHPAPPDSGVGSPPMPTPGMAPVQTPFGPMTVPGGGLTANSVISAAQSVAGRVPYVWGGFGPNGFDCSGLAAWLSNIATGRDPFGGGRFATGNEGPELSARGFIEGPGGPGELTIGWNADHTGITLPDGEHIDAEDEKDGIVLNGHSPGATGFPNVMHLPSGLGGGDLAGLMPGGVPGQLMDPSSTPMSNMGFRFQQMFNPQNMMNNIIGHYAQAYSPQNIMQFLGSQAQLAGQDMLGIFTQLVGGFTGLNLSPLIGYGDQIGNYGLSMIQSPGGGTPGTTDLNSAAMGGISQFMGGVPGISGMTGTGSGSGGGYPAGVAGNPTKMAVYQAMKQAGFPDSEWSALDALITGESSWNATNENSDSGAFGLFQFNPKSGTLQQYLPDKSPDPSTQAIAGMAYIKARYGTPSAAYQFWQSQSPHWYATGGSAASGLAWLSKGEYRTNAAATKYYGAGLFNALNQMAIPKGAIPGFADGGFPVAAPPTTPINPINNVPDVNKLVGPDSSVGGQAAQIIGAAAGAIGGASAGSGGGGGGGSNGPNPQDYAPTRRMGPPQTPVAAPPAPGAAAGLGGPGGVVKSNGATIADDRGGVAKVGAPPQTLDHLNPAISHLVQSAAGTIGSWAAMAAQLGITAAAAGGTFGAGAPAGAAAGAFAAQGIQAGAQMAGQAITDGLNVLAGFEVKNQGPANGTPLLPQRHNTSMAPPVAQKIHNGDINVTNLEEYKRANETMEAQQAMPFIGKYW